MVGWSLLDTLGLGDPLAGALLLALVAVGLISVLLALRDPIVARIGLRNVSRARSRTLILLLGLLVGSTIISSSLVVGTTVNTLATHFVYENDGAVNEAVYAPGASANILGGLSFSPFPAQLFTGFNRSVAGISGVQAVNPMVLGTVGLVDQTSSVAQPGLNLVGVDPSAGLALGPFTSLTGRTYQGPAPGEVLLNTQAANALSARAGDRVTLVGPGGNESATVEAVVHSDTRGDFQDTTGQGDVFVTIPAAQNLTGLEGAYDYLAITNVGGMTASGVALTSQVWPELNRSLAQALLSLPPLPNPPGVHSVLAADIAAAQSASSTLTTLFLVLGLFSIVAGSILIVGIFAMLAEERRGEIGVARAVGMRREQLVKSYYFEGLAYSTGSALLGTLLGVGVGYVMVYAFSQIFASGFGNPAAVLDSFAFTPGDLLTAYAVGFLLTLGTIVLTTLAISRLNLVRAIRNLPEPALARRGRLPLTGISVLLLAVGGFLLSAGLPAGADLSLGYLGMGFLLVGLGVLGAAWTSVRLSLSLSGLALVVFFGVSSLRTALLGSDHTGTIFSFFLQGLFLLLGSVTLYVFNSDLFVGGITRLFRGKARNVPVVRLAFSYPGQKRFRSGITVSIFAMVLFVIVTVAAIGASIQSNVNGFVAEQSGGYDLVGFSSSPVAGLPQYVQGHPALDRELVRAIPFYSGAVRLSVGGSSPFLYSAAAAPGNVSSLEDFYSGNGFVFTSILPGLTPAGVWQLLSEDRSVVVLDGSFSGGGLGFGVAHPQATVGTRLNVSTLGGSARGELTVVGILAESLVPMALFNPGYLQDVLGSNQTSFFLFETAPGASPLSVTQALQTHFFPQGLQILDLVGLLETSLQVILSFVNLLEIFAALGLVVGIAALGILALRAVTERRSQVGIVRAMGFRQSQVLSAFLLEYSFLALVGMGIGTALGLLMVYNLSSVGIGFFTLTIPWANLVEVLGLSYALTLLAVAGPSIKASRLPPAEAIRYFE
jgi:putative ABC transport system permease protein